MYRWLRAILIFAVLAICPAMVIAQPLISFKMTGVPQAIEQTIINSTSLSSVKSESKATTQRIQLLFARSMPQIKDALSAYGYFRSEVNGTLITLKPDEEWEATYQVNLGAPLKIQQANIDIQGAGHNDKAFQRLIDNSGLKIGDTLKQENFKKLRAALINTAISKGYFDAKLTRHQMRIDLQQYYAIVDITLETGNRYVFTTTAFDQTGYKFDEDFLRRYLNYKPGEPYLLSKVQNLQSNLSSSNYFSQVNVKTAPTKGEKGVDKVPVKIQLQTQKPQQYLFGLGYGTETGPRATIGANYRYLNKTGSHLSLQAQVSSIYQQVTANYIIPGENPVTDYTSINGGQNHTNIQPYSANTTLAGFDVSKQIGNWKRTLSLHQYYIRYVGDDGDTGKTHYLTPQIDLLYQKRRKRRFWYDGFALDWVTNGAVQKVFSKSTYIKSVLTGRYSQNINQSSRIFFLGSVGGIATSSLSALSPTLRFYTGGITSVRGYRYKTLSPLNENGKETGGKYLLIGSVNLEQHLFGNVSGIVFYDKGNAFNQWQNIHFASGAGFGFSYHSPVGPIRLYFSHPVNRPNSRWRIDFTIGTFL